MWPPAAGWALKCDSWRTPHALLLPPAALPPAFAASHLHSPPLSPASRHHDERHHRLPALAHLASTGSASGIVAQTKQLRNGQRNKRLRVSGPPAVGVRVQRQHRGRARSAPRPCLVHVQGGRLACRASGVLRRRGPGGVPLGGADALLLLCAHHADSAARARRFVLQYVCGPQLAAAVGSRCGHAARARRRPRQSAPC